MGARIEKTSPLVARNAEIRVVEPVTRVPCLRRSSPRPTVPLPCKKNITAKKKKTFHRKENRKIKAGFVLS